MSEKVIMNFSPPPAYPATPYPVSPSEPVPEPVPQPSSAAQLGEQYRSERMSLPCSIISSLNANIVTVFANCAKGIHEPRRKYGVFGIVTAAVSRPTCSFS
jgi:hypothetical protein